MARASETNTVYTCDICAVTHDSGAGGLPAGWRSVVIHKPSSPLGSVVVQYDICGDSLSNNDPAIVAKFKDLIAT